MWDGHQSSMSRAAATASQRDSTRTIDAATESVAASIVLVPSSSAPDAAETLAKLRKELQEEKAKFGKAEGEFTKLKENYEVNSSLLLKIRKELTEIKEERDKDRHALAELAARRD